MVAAAPEFRDRFARPLPTELQEITLDFVQKVAKITLDYVQQEGQMHRFASEHLLYWKTKPGRKPLVIRGARQVGKSYLVRDFGRQHFDHVVELNLERRRDLATLLATNDPQAVVRALEPVVNHEVVPGRTLLFIDEIQASPQALSALRYFYELMPELHVIAAGSLFDFSLGQIPHSMPVGRIEYLHLGPMQFEEFLLASGRERLVAFLSSYGPGEDLPHLIHTQLLDLFRTYLLVGGMPEAIVEFLRQGSYLHAEEAKHSILSTYQEDFAKYAGRVPHARLQALLDRIPALIGRRFKYSHADPTQLPRTVSQTLELLSMARVVHRVRHTAANGLPLAAEVNDSVFKVIFLDAGLVSTALGLTPPALIAASELTLVNSGSLAEQVIGQHLLYSSPPYQEPSLFYWARESQRSSAEVDYVVSEGQEIVPIEVKAGKTGRLKSLHTFLREKQRSFCLRFNSDVPSLLSAHTALADGNNIPFRLLSLPLYMVGQTRRLIREMPSANG